MRTNLPVTQKEYTFPESDLLVSTTDTKGIITHCNPAFVKASGFSYDELIGQPHNIIRHPDMPAAAYKDLWRTIGRGRPWTALVKNRRRNGDHYWVQANVTPILENGKVRGYMSVRSRPDAAAVREADALYAHMRAQESAGKRTVELQAGEVRSLGLSRWLPGRGRGPGLRTRLALALAVMIVLTLLPGLLGATGWALAAWQLGVLMLGAAAILAGFHRNVVLALREAERFAADMAGCNLATTLSSRYPAPLNGLMRQLLQVQINLRAVIGDVRAEVANFLQSADQLSQGSRDLSGRTHSQAGTLEETATSLEQLSGTVRQTAENLSEVADQSAQSARLATRGGEAVQDMVQTMRAIEQSSHKAREIVQVLEGIAFQTNILALNATVEAAHAGDRGRSFGVVASEVRALAQRSAEAAREIGSQLHHSSDLVTGGVGQMENAGTTIQEALEAVARVDGLIRRISVASREQSAGIAQISSSVVALDHDTRANAAQAGESAESAHDISHHSVSLLRSVQVFRIPGPGVRRLAG